MTKKFNDFINKIRKNIKESNCYYCNRNVSSFCNSHSIPMFVLKNISIDGKLTTLNENIQIPILPKEKGLKNSGTFKMICRECDSSVFQEYENPDNYANEPTQEMLAQISLKNYMHIISKRRFEIQLYESIGLSEKTEHTNIQNMNTLDMISFEEEFNYAKKSLKDKLKSSYYLCYYKKLDYVVPLAFQGIVSLVSDFNGNIINDIYNSSKDYLIKDLHICIFPLKESSIIFLFIKNNDRRYKRFYKQLRALEEEDQLLSICYIIFLYSEEIYLSPNLKEFIKRKDLSDAINLTGSLISRIPLNDPINKILFKYDLNLRKDFPNFLSSSIISDL